mmetsp:Transcript_4520/g.8600  ORF Transcript_4520/g.8600 Transcript_4520/m.8600 type:complete len:119 (-) Transcript_4520:873-1229(-)
MHTPRKLAYQPQKMHASMSTSILPVSSKRSGMPLSLPTYLPTTYSQHTTKYSANPACFAGKASGLSVRAAGFPPGRTQHCSLRQALPLSPPLLVVQANSAKTLLPERKTSAHLLLDRA